MVTRVWCGTLIDGTGRPPLSRAEVVVDGGRILRVGRREGAQVSDAADVIDLKDLTVMPGLVDAHDHLGLDVGDEEAQLAESTEFVALRAAHNARAILRSGTTTLRDLGEKGDLGVALRRAVEAGVLLGPRLVVAGRNICRTAGHGWFIGREADGPYGLRTAVRDEVRKGADLIKIMVTGGVATPGSVVLAPEFTDEEVTAAVDEAHRRGRRVAAHGYGGDGVRSAVLAGVDSIEHGAYCSPNEVQLMAERGTFLVSTASVYQALVDAADTPAFARGKARDVVAAVRRLLPLAREKRVKLAVGTDENHCRLHREIDILVEAGFPPMEALVAATARGAEVCGLLDQVGTLDRGKSADLIAVAGDPLTDRACLALPRLVMKAGAAVFASGRDAAALSPAEAAEAALQPS